VEHIRQVAPQHFLLERAETERRRAALLNLARVLTRA